MTEMGALQTVRRLRKIPSTVLTEEGCAASKGHDFHCINQD